MVTVGPDEPDGEPFTVTAKSSIPKEDLPEEWDELSSEEKRNFIIEYHESPE